MDIIGAKLNNKNPDEIERNILIFIQQSILKNHKLLAQELVSKWPNTNLNHTNFQRNNTLLMALISNESHIFVNGKKITMLGVTEEQLKLFLELKNKEGQPLVDPNCVSNGRTALEVALSDKNHLI